MAFSITRPALCRADGPRRLDPLWLVTGPAMLGLAAAVSFRAPEESLAIFLAALILFLAVADLRTGFLAFVALYPLMPLTWGIDVASWMPFLTAQRLCCIVLAVVFVLHCQHAFDTPRVRRLVFVFAVLVTLELLAGFASNDPLSAVKRIFDDVLEHYLLFVMAAHLFRTRAQVRTLLVVVLSIMALVSVLGIIEHMIGYDFYDSFTAVRGDLNDVLYVQTQQTRELGGEVVRRASVAFPHSIILGLHLMCSLLAAIYLIRRSKTVTRAFLLGAMLLFCLAMLCTYSRGPMLGLLCGMVWLGLIGRGTRPLLMFVLICGVCAYCVMPARSRSILTDTIATSTDMQTAVSTGGGTVRARLDMNRMGFNMASKRILFGYGPGEMHATKIYTRQGNVVDFSMLDNYYLAMELRYGIFVVIVTLYLLAYLLCVFTRAALRIPDRDAALLAAVAAAACVANNTVFLTMSAEFSLYWILLGAALRAVEVHLPVGKHRPPLRRYGKENHLMMGRSRFSPVRPSALPRPPAGRAMGVGLVLAMGTLAAASPTQAAPSFYGTTGLFATPTGAVAPRGAWSLGSNYVGRNYRPGASSISQGTVANFFTLTMLPRLELTVVLTNYEGKLGTRDLNHGLTPDFNLGGYTVDRTASAHWLAISQHGYWPSLAFGLRDFLGRPAKHLQAQYAVMSLNRGPLTLSAGVGTLALHGPFGGIQYDVTPRIAVIGEGLHGQANGGFRLIPLRDVQLDVAMMGLRSLGGGLSYRRRF